MSSTQRESHLSIPSTLGGLGHIRRTIVNFFNTTVENIEKWYREWEDLSGRVGDIDNGIIPYPLTFNGGGGFSTFDKTSDNVFYFCGGVTRELSIVNTPLEPDMSFRLKVLFVLDNGGSCKIKSVADTGVDNLNDLILFNPTVGDELSSNTGASYTPWNYIMVQSPTTTNRAFAWIEFTSVRTGAGANEVRIVATVLGTNAGMPSTQIDILGSNV